MTLSKKSSRKRGLLAVVTVMMTFAGLTIVASPAFATQSKASIITQPDICDNLAGIQAIVPDGYAVEYGLCTTPNAIHVVAADPTYTSGTCSALGTVVTTNTAQYTWEASGTSAATVETATPVGDVVLDGDLVYGRAVFGPYDLTKLSGEACPTPPTHVTVVASIYTPGTCLALGTVVATNTTQYTWATSGTEAATLETATAVGNVVLDGKTVFGPYDLSKLSGDRCSTPPTCTVTAPSPLTASWVKQYVDVVWTTNTGHFTAALKANVNLCGSVTILVSGYAVPSTWNGNGFNPTATPQQLVGTTKQIVLTNDVRTGEATADIPTCGNAQTDGYTPPEIVAVTSAGHGDQFIAGGLWHIGNCPPPAPITCTVTGAPGTESGDHPPVQTAEGVDYRSYHDGHATGVVIPINANAQGITSLSFTDTNVVGYGMFSRLIFDLSADGGPGYASFSVSPGNTIDQNAVAGVGSKNVLLGKTVAQVGIAYPHNKIVGWAFQTGSSYPGDGTASSDGATLTGTSGDCGNVNYVWPTVTFPTDSTSPATCAADKNAHTFSYTLPAPNANEKYELVNGIRPTAGTYFLGAGQTVGPFTLHTLASAQVQQGSVTFGPYTGQDEIQTQYTDSGKPCYVAPTVVKPVGPTTTDGTCVANAPVAGSATTFAKLVALQPAGVIAKLNTGSTTDGTFSADVSFVLANDAIKTFHLGTPVNKTASDCKELAHTGVEVVVTVLTALALVALGFFLLFLPWWRRRNNGKMA
jgi:hypothetical protein